MRLLRMTILPWAAAIISAALLSASLEAAEPQDIRLWPDGAPGAVGNEEADQPRITLHAPAADKANGCAVIVCPGGGYGGLAMSYEGHDVAEWFNGFGVTAFVLRYRHAPAYRHPTPLTDIQRAIRIVRARAKEWSIDPARVGVMGFSAGGHLASTAATHFGAGDPVAQDPLDRPSSRPDFAILAYPVISMTSEFTHEGSKRNLLGEKPAEGLAENLSNEKQVTGQTPPTFLFHTTDDQTVPAENSIAFYLALRQAKVPAEMHIYEPGKHGVGLALDDPILSSWPERLQLWLGHRGLLKPTEATAK